MGLLSHLNVNRSIICQKTFPKGEGLAGYMFVIELKTLCDNIHFLTVRMPWHVGIRTSLTHAPTSVSAEVPSDDVN